MKARCLLLLALGLLLGADKPAGELKKEADRLQGTWKAVTIEENGKAAPADEVKQFKLIVTGDKFALRSKVGDAFDEVIYKARFDATREPHTLDLAKSNFTAKEDIRQGIYQLDRDVLKLRLGKPGKERPVGFAVKGEAESTLFVLERDKP